MAAVLHRSYVRQALWVVGACVMAAALGLGTVKFGVNATVVGVAAVLGVLVWTFPGVAVYALVLSLIVFEDSRNAIIRAIPLYFPAPAGVSVLVVIVLLGTTILWMRRSLRFQPYAATALVYGAALLVGVGVATQAGVGAKEALRVATPPIYAILAAAFVSSWIGTDRGRFRQLCIISAAALVTRAVVSLGLLTAGKGTTVEQAGSQLILPSYDPGTIWLLVVAALCFVALTAAHLTTTFVARAATLCSSVAVLATQYLTLRRGLLLGLVAGLASLWLGRFRRRPLAIVGLGLVAIVCLAAAPRLTQTVAGSGVERTFVQDRSAGDQYRIAERANVLINIRENPLQGIGAGVPWTVYRPMQVIPGAESYAHIDVLWHWITFGVLGVFGYLLFMTLPLRLAWRASRRSASASVERSVLFGISAAFVAQIVADLTAAATGSDARFTLIAGVTLGLAVAAANIDRATTGTKRT